MNVFKVDFGEKILLVGEGNFSFSVGFINLNINVIKKSDSDQHNSVEIVTSCLESDSDVYCNKKHNIDLLQQKGCTVLQNVDATKLKEHPVIGCKIFTKVIFNFPHVGGKMKIHLNRKLLADFFSSTKDVLDKNGVILVTLCDGQGGTGADMKQRRWDDSWKIVEMAAISDFALKRVFQFKFDFFPNYVNIGYRSLQKGFCTKNALVHVFQLNEPQHLISLSNKKIKSFLELQIIPSPLENLSISSIHAQKISLNPFDSKNSLQKYLYDSMRNNLLEEEPFFVEENFIYGVSCQYSSAVEFVKDYFLNKRVLDGHSIIVSKGLLLKELTGDFGSQPVSCEVLCFGKRSSILVEKVIYKTAKDFKFSDLNIFHFSTDNYNILYMDNVTKTEIFQVKLIAEEDNCVEICTIFLDNIAKLFFNLDCWQQLWTTGNLVECSDKIMVYTPCLFPPTFTFDLSFSVQCSYLQETFFNILWQLSGNIVLNVELISTYEPPNKNCKNFCYRITYKSYELPLHRNRVIDIQRNIIGKTVEKFLNVTIL